MSSLILRLARSSWRSNLATYAEIYGEVRSLLRQNNTTLTDADLTIIHKQLARMLSEEKLPSLLNQKQVNLGTITRQDDNGYVVPVDEYDHISAVYGGSDNEELVVESRPAPNSGLDYYTFIGKTLTVYLGNSDEGVGGESNTVIVEGYLKYEVSGDGAEDILLERHPRLLVSGLLYQVKIWQQADKERISVYAGEYLTALEEARQESYDFITDGVFGGR